MGSVAKADDYLRLHRSFANFTTDAAWVHMAEGSFGEDPTETLRRYLLVLPDEFHEEAKDVIESWMVWVEAERERIAKVLTEFTTPKDVGVAVKAKTLPPYAMQAFLMSDYEKKGDLQSDRYAKTAKTLHKKLWEEARKAT